MPVQCIISKGQNTDPLVPLYTAGKIKVNAGRRGDDQRRTEGRKLTRGRWQKVSAGQRPGPDWARKKHI